MFYWFGVVGICTLGLNKGGHLHCICVFLNRFYWISVVRLCTLHFDFQVRASTFLNMFYWFGVVGLCTLGLNKRGQSALGKHIFLNRF